MIYLFLASVIINILLVSYIAMIVTKHKNEKAKIIKIYEGEFDEADNYL